MPRDQLNRHDDTQIILNNLLSLTLAALKPVHTILKTAT